MKFDGSFFLRFFFLRFILEEVLESTLTFLKTPVLHHTKGFKEQNKNDLTSDKYQFYIPLDHPYSYSGGVFRRSTLDFYFDKC